MNYSDNQLTALAQSNPKELARILISPHANTRTLTFGAEILGGEVADETIVLPVLRMLLKHVNAVVREGATIGLSCFYSGKKPPEDILARLKIMSASDPSPVLRDCAKSLLDEFGEIV